MRQSTAEQREIRQAHELRTTAERIAAQFGNDGQAWRDKDGQHLVHVCGGEAESWVMQGDLTRYEFADGSAIVTAPGGWDVEGDEPFSWEGAQ